MIPDSRCTDRRANGPPDRQRKAPEIEFSGALFIFAAMNTLKPLALALCLAACSESTPTEPLPIAPAPTVEVTGRASYPFFVGYTGTADSGDYAAVTYNSDGTVRAAYDFGAQVVDFQRQPSGTLTAYARESGELGRFVEFLDDGTVLREHRPVRSPETGVHELRLYADGSRLLYGAQREAVDMRPHGGWDGTEVRHCVVEYERPSLPLFTWSTADGMEYTDSYDGLAWSQINPYHVNAIDRDTDGDLLVSMRNASQVVKIDVATGNVLWRLGGKRNEFAFVGDPLGGFSRQHGIRRLPNGNIILFDNGNDHTPPVSRAVEYQLDEKAKTARMVWEYRDTTHGFAMGFAERLPNGNTLICFGTARVIKEVTPGGSVVFALRVLSEEMPYRAMRDGPK